MAVLVTGIALAGAAVMAAHGDVDWAQYAILAGILLNVSVFK